MLIRLNKLHAKGLTEKRKSDADGHLESLRFTLELTNPPGDLSLTLKGVSPDDAEHFAQGLIAGREYDLKVEITEHQSPQRTLEFVDAGAKAPADSEPLPI